MKARCPECGVLNAVACKTDAIDCKRCGYRYIGKFYRRPPAELVENLCECGKPRAVGDRRGPCPDCKRLEDHQHEFDRTHSGLPYHALEPFHVALELIGGRHAY